MEDGEGSGLMDESHKRTHDAVIEDLENEKMEVLNSNASTATLNMQNFGSSDYEHRDEEISGTTTFDCKQI